MHKNLAQYGETALVLQGGGALGAYQGGIYEALDAAAVRIDRIAGISIGSINAALIAGNPPAQRVKALREFWQLVTRQPLLPPSPWELFEDALEWPAPLREWQGHIEGLRAIMEGQRGFFHPRQNLLQSPHFTSFYDTAPLRATLESLVDFELLNQGPMRISVAAVNVRSGNFEVFDSAEQKLGPEHIMASGALPPGFPPVQVGKEFYWDGGLVSNTPLLQVLGGHPQQNTLVFQVDLWNAEGALPRDLAQVLSRQKDIQFSSRTRAFTDLLQRAHEQRHILRELLQRIPRAQHDAFCREVEAMARDERYNVVHMIYRDKPQDGQEKDYQFGRRAMLRHWGAGRADTRATLAHADWFALPAAAHPFRTHDLHRGG
ncbi:patatin-like phospholipase family protein [Metallibacterium sp.]